MRPKSGIQSKVCGYVVFNPPLIYAKCLPPAPMLSLVFEKKCTSVFFYKPLHKKSCVRDAPGLQAFPYSKHKKELG